MSRHVVIPRDLWGKAFEDLFPPLGGEGFAFALARICPRKEGCKYLVESFVPLDQIDIQYQHDAGVALTRYGSGKLNKLSVNVSRMGYVPVHIHSHPASIPNFSCVDYRFEEELSRWLCDQGQPFLISIVVPRGGEPISRVWHKGRPMELLTRIGLQVLDNTRGASLATLDRQLAFGPFFRASAEQLRVAIVGTGGIGLPVAEQLARCGFHSFLLMDPDYVEDTNLNRMQGLTKKDIGKRKVEVVKRIIQRAGQAVGTNPSVTALCEDVYNATENHRNMLRQCDMILALTDDHLSRLVCLELAFEVFVHRDPPMPSWRLARRAGHWDGK